MPETITREQLNEAINEFADKIMEVLGATVAGEETNKPEPTGTRFKAVDTNGEEVEMDATHFSVGAVVADGAFEYFRCCERGETGPWVRYSGESYSHSEFATEMRYAISTPRIVHRG